MHCQFHGDVEAIGVCSNCSYGLCADCMSRHRPPLCANCFIAVCKARINDAYVNLFLMGICFMVGYYIESSRMSPSPNSPVTIGFMAAAVLPGLKMFAKHFLGSFSIFMAIILGLPFLIVLGAFLAVSLAAGFVLVPVLVIFNIVVILTNSAAIGSARRRIRHSPA